MNLRKFIEAIKDEKNGFKFGKPWRYSKSSLSAVLPILRKSKAKRKYETLAEAKKMHISDTGSIDAVYTENKGKKPVFIRAGEIFKGKTQERAATVSRVVMPGDTAKIKVVCVHQSRPIQGGSKMHKSGYTPSSVENTLLNTELRGGSGQGEAWASVAMYAATTKAGAGAGGGGSTSPSSSPSESSSLDNLQALRNSSDPRLVDVAPSDDLVKNIEEHSKTIEEVLRSVPKVNWQVGMALLGVDGVVVLEAFDLPDSWTSIREDIVKKEGESISVEDEDSVFEYKPSKAKKVAQKPLGSKFSQKDLYKDSDSRTVGVETKKFVGEATLLGKDVIHLMMTRKQK